MRKHTSWRTGGPADRAYFPRDLDDLVRFVRTIPTDEPVHVVGLGSNLLVRDGGLRGTVVFTHGALNEVHIEPGEDGERLVYAEAGVASPKVARFAATHGLRGAEFLAGIPGTVGGALAMNAGCYGSETWEIVAVGAVPEARRRAGAAHSRGLRDRLSACRAAQRRRQRNGKSRAAAHDRPAPSASRRRPGWTSGSPPPGSSSRPAMATQSRRMIRELLQRRIATQPLDQPNAGSVFRNPPGDYAARLIESCGLKGFAIGGAMVSPKHANFIVNTGAATAADIETLIDQVQQTVWDRCHVRLEREVRIIGESVHDTSRAGMSAPP